jgi:hypothetical protein
MTKKLETKELSIVKFLPATAAGGRRQSLPLMAISGADRLGRKLTIGELRQVGILRRKSGIIRRRGRDVIRRREAGHGALGDIV